MKRVVELAFLSFALLALLSCGDSMSTTGPGIEALSGDPGGESPTDPADDGSPAGGDPQGESPSGDAATSSVTVLLTDDPLDLEHAWVDIQRVYLQGGDANGRLVLFEGPTGWIDLLPLADDVEELVESVEIPSGSFGQLRVVINGAAVETGDGEIFATRGSDPPGEGAVTGTIGCPSCSTSGFKVLLQGRDLSLLEPTEIMVLDFDVEESFVHQAGKSGRWMLRPVIKLFGDPAEAE